MLSRPGSSGSLSAPEFCLTPPGHPEEGGTEASDQHGITKIDSGRGKLKGGVVCGDGKWRWSEGEGGKKGRGMAC